MTDIKSAMNDLIAEQTLPLDQAIDRHFSPNYRQRTNGTWDDRAAFTQHIQLLRSVVKTMTIEVVDELRHGQCYADRHIVDIEKRDGARVIQEVYLFAQLAEDGRFDRVEETTLMLAGDEADRDLGNAR